MLPRIRSIIMFGCLIAIMLASPLLALAQDPLHLTIDQVDSSRFPQVDIVVSVRDSFNRPVQGLFAEHFTISEAGKSTSDFNVLPILEQPIDLVLVMDTSATMGFGSKPTPLQSAARAARNLVNNLGDEDKTAVIAFGDNASIVQPLTSNKHPVNACFPCLSPPGILRSTMQSWLHSAFSKNRHVLQSSFSPMDLIQAVVS